MDLSLSYNDDEHIESHFSKTQTLELAYQETIRNADLLIKDEGARRLRLRILMLENENDELHEQLSLGDDRIDVLEQEAEDLRSQLSTAQEEIARQDTQIRSQARELSNIKAELKSMNGVTTDSAKVLTEKLSLSRELAALKPELEHLRSQATYQQTVLAEKLALERQVSTLEVELEAEKRASKRAAKNNNNQERELELQGQVDELQKELAREKRERKKSRDGAEINLQNQVEDLRKDLAREKREAEKARSELEADLRNQLEELQETLDRQKRESAKARKNVNSDLQDQLESLQQDLSREKKENEKLRKEAEKAQKNLDSDLNDRLETLKQDLTREKKEGEQARKEAEKDRKASETQHTILESKLDQFRTKLRSAKEELKEYQAELSQSKAAATKTSRSNVQAAVPTKIARKRGASEMDDDMPIGTPDGVVVRGKRQMAKKGRAEQTMVGEKSMFSITPFLNRTVSMAPDTPGEDEASPAVTKMNRNEVQEKVAQVDLNPNEASPAPAPKPKGRKQASEKPKGNERPVLGEPKSNAKAKKPAPKAARAISNLEKVTEEEEDENEQLVNEMPPMKIFIGNDFSKPAASKAAKPTVADDAGAKKKKRKLGEGKTLFDDDDGEVTKRPAKVTLGAPRLLSKGGLAGPKGGLKGGLIDASGFGGFSPLKKDRRGIGASFLS